MNDFIDITKDHKDDYNNLVTHPLQSFEWGEFRKKTGIKVIRRARLHKGKLSDAFTLTLHKIPFFNAYIGYFPKGDVPTSELLNELVSIGKDEKCVYIQLEPNVTKNKWSTVNGQFSILKPSFHPLFTRYTFILDLTKTEDELLSAMHPKTRYNIKVAQKHGVKIIEDNSDEAFKEYLRLTFETTTRQKFYAHTESYHRKQFETLPHTFEKNSLSSHLLKASYTGDAGKVHTLVSWILFIFHKTLYYPYGASSNLYRNTMASNLIMWEAIKFGKQHGCTSFDMWGALGPEPDPKDSWFGFHRFKEGYGARLTEFVGSYDLVINPVMYEVLKIGDKLRWAYLRLKRT